MKEERIFRLKTAVVLFLFAALTSSTMLAQAAPQNQRQKLGGSAPSEQGITREVRHELLLLPYYNVFDWLGYKVNGATVTLVGQVTNPGVKSDAEAAVKSVKGVESVENQIEVLPPSPDDDRIRRTEYRAIYGYDSLSRYAWGPYPAIHIIVKNGHVTLMGAVDSQMDKQLAVSQAKSVPDVFSVTDKLTVGNTYQ
jgi:hyperosmotically inducible protein